ncbi:MAG: DUF126 domain-containing protein [Methanocellales archaeon]|nr:DUF126 domain-containing protein [Methanocellales archaeon]MDD3291362.1 DUF126 domain-containing protein [Methanocellales archaeon]MDD5234748.1 DUF126 domain-containing protein [Methanocellales archaeon]MDD5484901.1 DUF126 domain-containing protein [Methanocellales archaeon]
MKIKGRAISRGVASGRALVTSESISFLGGVDPLSGRIIEEGSELFSEIIANRVLVFPQGKGSTVGSYVLYQLMKNGVAPCAMINVVSEAIVAVGAIISGIPLVDCLQINPLDIIHDGDMVLVNGTEGYVEVIRDDG